MTLKYRLIRPVVVIGDDDQVLTIPAWETVAVAISNSVVGLCVVSWDGRLVRAFREDVLGNGIALTDEPFEWVN